MKEVEKEQYTYLGIVELKSKMRIKDNKMKEKTIKKCKQNLWFVL